MLEGGGGRFAAKLLFTVSSGMHVVACVPPATAKLSHRINFKGLEENEGHYRHWIFLALHSKLKAIDRRLCFVLSKPLQH